MTNNNQGQARKDIAHLMLSSISANANSLNGQLADYEFLKISDEQLKKISEFEKEFHNLVNEIVSPKFK